MQSFVKTFKKFDIFGQEIRLLEAGQPAFRTQIGAIMTLILFSILSYSQINKGKNANLNSKEAAINGEEGFTFNSSELIFAVGLLDFMGQPIPNDDNRVFKILFYFCNKSLNQTDCFYIPGNICGNRIREISQQLNIPNEYENITYCLSQEFINKNPTIRLQGSTRQDNFTLLGALVEKCKNSSVFTGCASKEEIDKYIKNANLYYSFSFHQFNKELENSPYEKTQDIEVTPVYYKVRKYIKIYFQYSQSFLEYNPFYFFPKEYQYDGIEFQNVVIDSALNYDDDNVFAQLELNLDPKKRLHYVQFQTLMDVAAKIGGLFTIIRVIFYSTLYPIQYILYRLHLINNVIKQKQLMSNNVDEHQKASLFQITIFSLIKSAGHRQLYKEQSFLIEKLLDITEILVNPIRFTRQVEDLQGSLRRFDQISYRQTKKNTNYQVDEMMANNDIIDLKSFSPSPRSINDELKQDNSTNFRVPKLNVRIS